jgi:hypothetical protein
MGLLLVRKTVKCLGSVLKSPVVSKTGNEVLGSFCWTLWISGAHNDNGRDIFLITIHMFSHLICQGNLFNSSCLSSLIQFMVLGCVVDCMT